MEDLILLCRTVTTFVAGGALDEQAFAAHCQRLSDSGHGLYIGSAGSGEGHALSLAELDRLYRVGVEVCKGRVPVNSNHPEQHTPEATLVHARVATAAGVDVVNVYGPAGWHGYRPSDAEYLAFHDDVLTELDHPVALSPHAGLGYLPSADLVAKVCRKYPQVAAINISSPGDAYFIALRERLPATVKLYVHFDGSLQTLPLGAAGLLSVHANLLPKSFRQYIEDYRAGRLGDAARLYFEVRRFMDFIEQWRPSNARWLKMGLRVLRLPGGEGGLREPYLMPPEAELRKLFAGLRQFEIAELVDLVAAADSSMAA